VDRRRVVITGVGVASPLGAAPDELWRRVLASESAARVWPDLASEGFRSHVACRIDDFDAPPLRRGRALALHAAEQAVRQARISLPTTAGVFLGSTMGESLAFERAGEGEPLPLEDYTVESFTRGVRERFGLEGPAQSIATACAAGNYAVGAALDALRLGRADVALAGAAEPFSRLAMLGFSRSRAMAADLCRPFDRRRNGMLLGEGAAVFVLERVDDALRRGAEPLAEVVSLGLSCDAFHATAPSPDGSGMRKAMRNALDGAGIQPADVDWVNVHGSGTRRSDAAEALALRDLFGDDLPAVSGSKGALGHALGASSALELALCVSALAAQTVPPTSGHELEDVEHGVACTQRAAPRELRWVLNNAFAFGGVNSSLALRRWTP
jgi:3-oxoacyl-[acyl-carrier-protein] synthase II